MKWCLLLIAMLLVASKAGAQSVVAAGTCAGTSTAGVFATSSGNCGGNPPTLANAGDTLAICVVVQSGILGNPVVTETAKSATVNQRITKFNSSGPALTQWMGDVVNGATGGYTISSQAGTGTVAQRIIWEDLTSVTATPFDQSGGIQVNSTASLTLLGVTSAGSTSQGTEIAFECAAAANNETSMGSPTNASWTVPANGTSNAGPSTIVANFVTNAIAPVIGTNFATLTSTTQSLVGMTTYIASSQLPTPTPTATATGPTPTATPTATPTCSPTPTGGPTATPTATPSPVCTVPAAVATVANLNLSVATNSIMYTYPNAITQGHTLAFVAGLGAQSFNIRAVSDNVNGNWTGVNACVNGNEDIENEIYIFANSAAASAGTLTVTINFLVANTGNIAFFDVPGLLGPGANICNQGNGLTAQTGLLTPSTTGTFLLGGMAMLGTNAFGSLSSAGPTFQTIAQGTNPLNVPIYVPQNQFLQAQATMTTTGSASDWSSILASFKVCPQGNVYEPLAY